MLNWSVQTASIYVFFPPLQGLNMGGVWFLVDNSKRNHFPNDKLLGWTELNSTHHNGPSPHQAQLD